MFSNKQQLTATLGVTYRDMEDQWEVALVRAHSTALLSILPREQLQMSIYVNGQYRHANLLEGDLDARSSLILTLRIRITALLHDQPSVVSLPTIALADDNRFVFKSNSVQFVNRENLLSVMLGLPRAEDNSRQSVLNSFVTDQKFTMYSDTTTCQLRLPVDVFRGRQRVMIGMNHLKPVPTGNTSDSVLAVIPIKQLYAGYEPPIRTYYPVHNWFFNSSPLFVLQSDWKMLWNEKAGGDTILTLHYRKCKSADGERDTFFW